MEGQLRPRELTKHFAPETKGTFSLGGKVGSLLFCVAVVAFVWL